MVSLFWIPQFEFFFGKIVSLYSVFGFGSSEECGVMIAIALFDMHECGEKRREPKRFKCVSSDSKPIGSFGDEPRSPFVFFVYCNHNLTLFLDYVCI